MNKLIVNGFNVDLSISTNIGVTKQINNLADLNTRQGDTTNIFKLPKTKNNRIVFENSENVNSGTSFPYQEGVVDYFEKGIQIIFNGKGVLVNMDKSFYYYKISSGITNFFDSPLMSQIVGRLYDVPFADLPNYPADLNLAFRGLFVQWHQDEILNARDGSLHYIFPIVDCKISAQKMLFDIKLQSDKMLLCLFIKDVFERYIKSIGWTISGDFISSDIYPKLLLTPDNVEYLEEIILGTTPTIPAKTDWTPYDFYKKVDFTSVLSTDIYQAQGGIGSGEVFITDFDSGEEFFSKFVINPSFEPAGVYEDSVGFKGSLTFEYDVDQIVLKDNPLIVWITIPITGYELLMYNVTTGDLLYSEVVYENNDFEDQIGYNGFFTVDGVFYPDHKYKFVHRIRHQERGQDGYTLNVNNSITLISTSFEKEQVYGGVMFFNQLFNIKTIDVFKDVMKQFCLICQTNNLKQEVIFTYFDTILKNIPIAEDWSSKVDTRNIKLYFKIGNYTNKNNFKYKENDFVTLGFGDGTLLIEIDDIDFESTQIELKTSATESYEAVYQNIIVPETKLYTDDWTPQKVNNRILILDIQDTAYNLNLTDGNHSDTINTNIPFARFYDATKDENLNFDSLIENHYEAISGILTKPKKVTLFLNLTANDVKNLNYIIPIKLNVQENEILINGFFYINKINAYKGGLTEVEFIRI